jgi:uroporphyrinogen decarboxylase
MSAAAIQRKGPHGAKPPVAASGPPATNRQRFLDACRCQATDRPPVWLMRQAGRALPEYRKLKEKHSFVQMVQTPELAAEVTLQPIRRFDFDAAILFSDILVVAEGMGQGYEFRDGGGIKMDFLIKSSADIDGLQVEPVTERLAYVDKALRLIKADLAQRTALIGFAGSPWTLANFMLEGGGVKEYTRAKQLLHLEPALLNRLLEKLTGAVTQFLQMQIAAGVDAIQIFDSLGGVLSDGDFVAGSGKWLKRIIGELKGNVPVIVFSKGSHGNWRDLVDTRPSVIGIDANVNLGEISRQLPSNIAVQGNLDPFLLTTTPASVRAETTRVLSEMRGRAGHIFNLGHGVPPNAKLENIQTLVDTIRNFSTPE